MAWHLAPIMHRGRKVLVVLTEASYISVTPHSFTLTKARLQRSTLLLTPCSHIKRRRLLKGLREASAGILRVSVSPCGPKKTSIPENTYAQTRVRTSIGVFIHFSIQADNSSNLKTNRRDPLKYFYSALAADKRGYHGR
jgi:hypothetical protein